MAAMTRDAASDGTTRVDKLLCSPLQMQSEAVNKYVFVAYILYSIQWTP